MSDKPGSKDTDPKASRPSLPRQYGIRPATQGRLLPWSWAAERLAKSRGYWMITTRPDGSPHATVVWGVWLDDVFYFSTAGRSRKGRNLARDPRCVVCPEDTHEAVIVEAVAERVKDRPTVRKFVEGYKAKYKEGIDTEEFTVYAVRPRIAFAFIADAVDYPATATRWEFREQ